MRVMVRAVWAAIAPYWRIVRLLPGVSAPMTLAVGVALGALLPLATTLATGALIGAVTHAPKEPDSRPSTRWRTTVPRLMR